MKLGFGLPVTLACLLAASSVSASPVDLILDSLTATGKATINKSPVTPQVTGTYYAAGFNMTGPTGPLSSFVAFCLDISHEISIGATNSYSVTSTPFSNSYGLTDWQTTRVQNLFDANYGQVGFDLSSANNAASFQAALWESLYEAKDAILSLADGDFKASGDFLGDAAGYLQAASEYNSYKRFGLTYLESNDETQNLVTVSAVPLPAGGLLLISAIAGIGAIRRKRKSA